MSSDRADQYACTAELLDITPDAAIVSNLGIASYVLAGVADRPRNFYLWGSMGVTSPVGLGLALAVDEPVTVLDGDGSLLMSLGHLATISTVDPGNLTIVVFDNGEYGTTGGQPTSSDITAFADVAAACGLTATAVETVPELAAAYREAQSGDHATLIECAVEPLTTDDRPPLDFAYIKKRVRNAFAD